MSDTPSGSQGVPNIAFSGTSFTFQTGTTLTSPSDGTLLFSNAAGTTAFLQFGGTSNAFPALKRVGTSLQSRLADDSAFAQISLSAIGFGTFGSRIDEPADGILRLLNAAGTNFNRLQFGGSTAAFPALIRNGTALNCKLADDSTFAPFQSGQIFISTAATGQAGTLNLGSTTQATVGAAGAAAALPALPLGYLKAFTGATAIAIPYYTQ